MTEDTSKHLDFVEQVIARMNSNSFQLKTWAVTLTAGLFALSDKSNPWFALIALLPVIVFWMLDAYYLRMEKQYRNLYELLCGHADDVPNYSKANRFAMDLTHYDELKKVKVKMRTYAFSKTQLWVYLPLLLTIGIAVAAMLRFPRAS